ncbi:hypothetical protein, partial [Acinetobacter pecorum]
KKLCNGESERALVLKNPIFSIYRLQSGQFEFWDLSFRSSDHYNWFFTDSGSHSDCAGIKTVT